MFFDLTHLKRWPSKTRQKMKKTVKKPLFCQKYVKTAKKAVFDVFFTKKWPWRVFKMGNHFRIYVFIKKFQKLWKSGVRVTLFEIFAALRKNNWISENFRTIITKFPNFSLVSTRSIAIMGHFRTTFSKMRWPKLSDFRK